MLTAKNLRHRFGKTPLPLLRSHLELGIQCTEQIPQILKAASAGDTGAHQALKFKVNDLAQHADEIFSELTRDWPKGVLVPTRHRDVLLVIESQERIINVTQKIAAITQLRLEIPSEISQLKVILVKHCIRTCRQALKVLESIESAVRSGLMGPDLAYVYAMAEDARKNDKEARTLGDEVSAALYEHYNGLDAASLVFVSQLTDLLVGLSRHARVAGQRALMFVSR